MVISCNAVLVWPWPATKGHTVALFPLPPLGWGGEWKETGKKLVDRDKGSLSEQQTKWTATTTILIIRIHKTNSEMHRATLNTRCPAHFQAATALSPGQLPHPEPSMMVHGIEYPVLFGSACLVVSPPGFWWKLTLSWLNPGQTHIFKQVGPHILRWLIIFNSYWESETKCRKTTHLHQNWSVKKSK